MNDFTTASSPPGNPEVSPYVLENWERWQSVLVEMYPHPSREDLSDAHNLARRWMDGLGCDHEHESLVRVGPHFTYQCDHCWRKEGVWRPKVALPADEVLAAIPVRKPIDQAESILYQGIMHAVRALRTGVEEEERRQRQDEYSDYLLSPHWLQIKRMVRQRSKGICENCGERPVQEVHHLTYIRRGHEKPFDVVGVCSECHQILDGRKAG